MQLVITEKPRASEKIAFALADSKVIKKSESKVPYYELTRNGKKVIVACAVGHLFGLGEKVKSGKYPVGELEWKLKAGFTKKYSSVIKKLAKKSDEFVVACDYDVEGETIGINVIRLLCNQKDAKRMKFSTLTKNELEKAYEEMSNTINWGQAMAGETRHNLDYMFGISLSRALMQAIKKGGIFRKLSIGRVQGPALHILAKKEHLIKKFKPTPYWNVSLLIKNGEEVTLDYSKNITKKSELKDFEKLKDQKVKAKTTTQETKTPPGVPFDLTTLQTEAYKFLGITPSQVLKIAQTLYLEGVISYPRTSSQKLPASIGYDSILKKLTKSFPQFKNSITKKKPIEGNQSDPAHPSIFPTGDLPKNLDDYSSKLYMLIVKRFLACFADNALIENKKILVSIGKKNFSAKGLTIKKRGWMEIYPSKIEESYLPDINGDVLIKDVLTEEKETKPPKRYSQASLVTELSKRKLGTKGTRALILDTLYERGYIKEKSIVVTDLGLSVDKTLDKYSSLILDEELTRNAEEAMEELQSEKNLKKLENKKNSVLIESKKSLDEISNQLKENEVKIGKDLAKSLKSTMEQQKSDNVYAKCDCGENLMLRISKASKKRFVACSGYPKCTTTFPLPQQGFIQKTGKACPDCGKNMITIIKKGKKPWTICFAGCSFKKNNEK